MKHKHHIIPKHAGGTDDPSNIIELTIEEHAIAHKKLYEEYKRWQDFLAWKGLSNQITKEEILKEIYRNNGKINGIKNKGKPAWNKGLNKENDPRVEKYAENLKGKFKSEKHRNSLKKPKANSKNMGRYERTDKTKELLSNKAKDQYNEENKKKHSILMKNKRSTCKYCGMESNTSNITRHERKCEQSFPAGNNIH